RTHQHYTLSLHDALPIYRAIRKALAAYDGQKLLIELNSAVGTLEKESREERLEELIKQLEQYPEALGDYRKWLDEKGIDTEGMRDRKSTRLNSSHVKIS